MWKELAVFNIKPDMYLINENGIIYNKKNKRYVSTRINMHGYVECTLYLSTGELKRFTVHRLVMATFTLCRSVNRTCVNHIDLDKTNNHISNLEWVSDKENCIHSIMNHSRKLTDATYPTFDYENLNKCGENNGTSILTNNQVHEICKLMEQNITYSEILERLGLPVTKNMLDILTKIRSKKLWYFISKQYNIPNKEYRTPATHYTTEQIEKICEILGNNINENIPHIASMIGVEISTKNKKEYDKFIHFVLRIKNKQTFTEISNKYF